MTNPLVPVILGPTASGKTAIGLRLAALINGEIISVDSRKVYRGLPVGTATPRGEWKGGVFVVDGIPHHLTGFLSPDQPYAAGDFARDSADLIADIFARGKTPILVGGTGFYLKALQEGLPTVPERHDEIRNGIEDRLAVIGVEALHAELDKVDPVSAARISPHDKHKIIRALEVHKITGKPLSEWKDIRSAPAPFRYATMGVDFNKEQLDLRIEERSRRMATGGMIEEAAALIQGGFAPDCPALASFGYREAVQVIRGDLDRKSFLPLLIKGTRAYAKRQRTWFRTQVKPAWFMCDQSSDKDEISMRMKAFFEGLKA